MKVKVVSECPVMAKLSKGIDNISEKANHG